MITQLFKCRDLAASNLPYSQEAEARQIELRFVERVVSAATRNVTVAAKNTRARQDEALMRAVEAGTFDEKIGEALRDVKPSELRNFDEAEPFSYPDWAARKLKSK